MTTQRLSDLEEKILAWLWRPVEERRMGDTMAASYQDLIRTLVPAKGNLSASLRHLEAKGLITVAHPSGDTPKTIKLTEAGLQRAEVMVEGWATAMLSSEHGLARLGGCLVWFQRIEETLSFAISALMGTSRKVGEIVTSEMSFRAKVAVYSALCHHALGAEKLPEDLQQLVSRLHWAEQERNTIAHSLWDAGEELPETIRREKRSSKRGRLTTTVEHFTPEDLEDLRGLFEGIVADLFYLTAMHIPRLRRRLGWRPMAGVKASPGPDPT